MEQRTVLFVDDDEQLLACIARIVATEPYESLFARSGQEALAILAREQVHVLVTDMRMPVMKGLELLKTVKQRYPAVVRVVLSGDSEIDTLMGAINEGKIAKFIPKPWNSSEELTTIIREAIEFHDLPVK
jgi:DNA-binding NtrC family response regulator